MTIFPHHTELSVAWVALLLCIWDIPESICSD